MRQMRCMYCHALILGVDYSVSYPDVHVLFAHKTCHSERKGVDPQTIWKILCETLQDLKKWPDSTECRAHAIEILEDLVRWLKQGGFAPDVLKVCAQMVAQAVLNNPMFKEEQEDSK